MSNCNAREACFCSLEEDADGAGHSLRLSGLHRSRNSARFASANSPGLLNSAFQAVRQGKFLPDGTLPRIHISGCPFLLLPPTRAAALGFGGGIEADNLTGPKAPSAVFEGGCFPPGQRKILRKREKSILTEADPRFPLWDWKKKWFLSQKTPPMDKWI